MAEHVTLISLADVVLAMKAGFQEHVDTLCDDVFKTRKILSNYDHRRLFAALLHDIFNRRAVSDYANIYPSTKILIEDGLTGDSARIVAMMVFTMMINIISTYFPDAKFNNDDRYSFELHGFYDLKVTMNY